MTTTPITGAGTGAATSWSRSERVRLGGVILAIAVLHVVGWTLYLYQNHQPVAAGGFAGAGTLAYALGVRHAFDADHIAAIDDTTRLLLLRGRRPVGVGFFFAIGHSAVVLLLALLVGTASATLTGPRLEGVRQVGTVVATLAATAFLILVAGLNAVVLRGLLVLWRRLRSGGLDPQQLDLLLLNRGLLFRILGPRARLLVRSSWHMAAVGFLFGLGLESASEVTLLSLSASTASANSGAGRALVWAALITLPLLFAAGMTAMDTADSLLMARAYSWAHRSPARRLYYNLTMTAMTVLVGGFIGSVYLVGLVLQVLPGAGAAAHGDGGHGHGPGLLLGWLRGYAGIADHFQQFGYGIVVVFVLAWLAAAGLWRLRGYDRRYQDLPGEPR